MTTLTLSDDQLSAKRYHRQKSCQSFVGYRIDTDNDDDDDDDADADDDDDDDADDDDDDITRCKKRNCTAPC